MPSVKRRAGRIVRHPVDIYRVAHHYHRYATVMWSAEDVQDKAAECLGLKITLEQAEKWLVDNEKYVQEGSTKGGFDVIEFTINASDFPEDTQRAYREE